MSSRIPNILIDDSAFMRKMTGDIIRTDDSIELVGVATDGKQGSELTLELSEIIMRRLSNPKLGHIFPGYKEYKPLGFMNGNDLKWITPDK